MSDFTQLLNAIEAGNPQAAAQLLPLVYDELRQLAAKKLAQESTGQTLDATALVHEAYLRARLRRISSTQTASTIRGAVMSEAQSPANERRDIDGKGRTIWELFNNRRYDIDSFQREYKWQTKQLVELIDDLIGQFLEHYEDGQELSAVATYGHYFLGSIILSQKEGKSFVIDGQQRH